jgi:hypothetical protein
MNESIKMLASPELIAAMSTRDAEGNRLSVEIGEPDADGFYTPWFTVHYDDNLLERFQPLLDERCHQDEKWGVQDHPDAAWLMILAEEVGEAAELVLATMQPGDPYRRNVRRLVEVGKKAKQFIGEACDLGGPQRENIPGVKEEAIQITTVGMTWLDCVARRAAKEKP